MVIFEYSMSEPLNVWKIEVTKVMGSNEFEKKISSYFEFNNNCTYLLDTNKNNYSLIEKTVLETAMFHFKRLNIEFDHRNHSIEFWFKKNYDSNNLHIDCDEYDKAINNPEILKIPFLSCVTYLNNNNIPTIITNVTNDIANNELLTNNHTFELSFPKYLKHISFHGGNYYHGSYNVFNENDSERNILAINLWENKPNNVPYFNNDEFEYRLFSFNRKKIEGFRIDKKQKLIDIVICNKNTKRIVLNNENQKDNNFFSTLFDSEYKNNIKNHLLENNYSEYDVISFDREDNSMISSKNIEFVDINLQKFIQRILIRKFYQKEMCEWIIHEVDNYINLNKIENPKIEIDDLKSIFNYVMISLGSIMFSIKENYSLTDKNDFDIKEICIANITQKNSCFVSNNDSDLTVSLCLKKNNNDEKCGITFHDGITTFMETGDLIINKSDVKYNFINQSPCYFLLIRLKILTTTII